MSAEEPGPAARAAPTIPDESRHALFVTDTMPDGLPALIESVTFGTDGLRYRRLDAAAQIARLHEPTFIGALDSDTLIGAYVLDRRSLLVAGHPVRGIYRGGLCVAPAAQGRGLGRALAERGRAWIDERATGEGVPYLAWGCIDESNRRSGAVLRARGAVRVGGLAMFMSYRQWPRERLPLETLPPSPHGPLADRHDAYATALEATQADCIARDVTPSASSTLLLRDAEGVRIGARVAESGYRIETMGAALDTLVRLTVTPFPPARRRFDPRAFRYVCLSDIAVRAGCERDWPAFVSSVLARHGAHFALTFLDPTSRLHARLRRIGWLGPVVHSTRPSIDVMARWSLPDATTSAFSWSPSGSPDSLVGPIAGSLALVPVDG